MRPILLAALVAFLSSCSYTRLPAPAETWYVVPTALPAVTAYETASATTTTDPIGPGERFQVVAREGAGYGVDGFYRVRTSEGRTAYVRARPESLVRYVPAVHGEPDALARVVRARRACAEFANWNAAQAAFRGGASELDGDGDGNACEHLSTARSNARPAARRSSGSNCHWVRGHTRRVNGRTVRVRGHRRCR